MRRRSSRARRRFGLPPAEHYKNASEHAVQSRRLTSMALAEARDGHCGEAIQNLRASAVLVGRSLENAEQSGRRYAGSVLGAKSALERAEDLVVNFCAKGKR